MAGDEIGNDLGDALDENDVSSENQPDLSVLDKGPVIMQPAEPGLSAKSSGVHIELPKIPDISSSFRLMEDGADRLVSLKEVDHELAKDKTMDARRAEYVAESFPGLFSAVSKGGYTRIPTRANFRETIEYVRNAVAKEEAQLLDVFKAYIEDPVKAGVAMLTEIKEKQFPALIRSVEVLKEEFDQNHTKLFSAPDDDAQERYHFNLFDMDVEKYQTRVRSVAEYSEAVAAIKTIITVRDIEQFVKEVLREDDHAKEVMDEQFIVNMCILSKFVRDSHYLADLKLFADLADKDLKGVEVLVNQARAIADKPEKISEFIIKNSVAFVDFDLSLKKYSTLVYNLTLLNIAIRQLFATYKEV